MNFISDLCRSFQMHLAQQSVLHRSVRYWRINGISYRVPTSDVSIVDLNVALKTESTYEDICKKMKEASETTLKEILDYVDDEVVSSDFIGDNHASSFDAREGIQVNGHFFKLISFYDNEWGYTS